MIEKCRNSRIAGECETIVTLLLKQDETNIDFEYRTTT